MSRIAKLPLGVLLLLLAGGAQAASFIAIYPEPEGEGYNSRAAPDPLSAQGGNPGDTLGEQRRWAFEQATEFWGARLQSNIPIRVSAQMAPLACSDSGAVLGSAGPSTVFRFNSGAIPHPRVDTWYVSALTDRLSNDDADETSPDIVSKFNSAIDNGCFSGITWYYALGDPPPGRISFFETVVHEIGHGLGVISLVSLSDDPDTPENDAGENLNGYPDVYSVFLEDHSLGQNWPDMSPAQRAASFTDTNDLHWTGPDVLAGSTVLADGFSGGHVEIYAPATLNPGSSVSHWDLDVKSAGNQFDVMRPIASDNPKLLVTDDLLHDIGWNDVPAGCVFAQDQQTLTGTFSGANDHGACETLIYDGAVISSGATHAVAGLQIILRNGFRVEAGAIFSASTSGPEFGL